MNQAAAEAFERSFLSASLAKQIADCGSYELAPLLLELFTGSQPVLEAGCGSGRWCGWFHAHGIAADGIDWSSALCERAARELPTCRFFARDMTDSGLPGGSYGGVLALGSVEHSARGPLPALAEFHRLLRPGGVALITVPHGSWLRRWSHAIRDPFASARAWPLLRRLAGKPPLSPHARSRREARRSAVAVWHPRFTLGPDGWAFYEYHFNSRQFESFLHASEFTVRRGFAAFADEGLLHTFGRLAGHWNAAESRVHLNPLGLALRRLLPVALIGHMLCYVVEKK